LGVGLEVMNAFRGPWFEQLGIETVVDVGANTGQFTQAMHAILPRATIYAFEPLPDCYETLVQRTKDFRQVHTFNVGLGAEAATLKIQRNPYPDSSSFRPMTNLHREQFPFTAGRETPIEVPVRTLDSYIARMDLRERVFLKIDVQGYEDAVLDGGRDLVARASLILLEVCFAPLYEGAPTFAQLYERLWAQGFAFRGFTGQLLGPQDGAILQGDALFFRREWQ
jgi:FkbM family methyltransferase